MIDETKKILDKLNTSLDIQQSSSQLIKFLVQDLLDYAQIKSYSMVAAGALVTNNKIVEENELWAGVPAKFLRKLKKEEVGYIDISKDRYVNLAKDYMY